MKMRLIVVDENMKDWGEMVFVICQEIPSDFPVVVQVAMRIDPLRI